MNRGRGGFALASSLFALVLLSALAAAVFGAALGEWRAGRSVAEGVTAGAAARSGLAVTVAGWDPRWSGGLRPGQGLDLGGGSVAGGSWQAQGVRLSADLVLVQVVGRTRPGLGRRELGLVARFRRMVPFPPAAVFVRESLDAGVLGGVSGVDAAPPEWNCPPPGDSVPAVQVDTTSADDVFFGLGGLPWPEVLAWARAVPAGGDSLGVRLEAGPTELGGVRFAGILVVDGDLSLRAGSTVIGVVLVRGEVVVGEGGGEVIGTLVARSIRRLPGVGAGALAVRYSRCAASAAGGSRAPLEPVPGASRLPLW